jgi:hypothetical protein
MIFWQPVFTAELVSAVRTPERKKCFLPAFSAFHALPTHFHGKSGVVVYMFPSENPIFPRARRLGKCLKQATLKIEATS